MEVDFEAVLADANRVVHRVRTPLAANMGRSSIRSLPSE